MVDDSLALGGGEYNFGSVHMHGGSLIAKYH